METKNNKDLNKEQNTNVKRIEQKIITSPLKSIKSQSQTQGLLERELNLIKEKNVENKKIKDQNKKRGAKEIEEIKVGKIDKIEIKPQLDQYKNKNKNIVDQVEIERKTEKITDNITEDA